MNKLFILISVLLSSAVSTVMANLVDEVNPMIGTDNHGHVFIGANVPFGAVNVGPNELGQGWDWCSGYNYSDTRIKGFSMLHLSGPGCADLGDVCLMPVVGKVTLQRGNENDENSGFFSTFSRQNETVRPGYYSVLLDRFKVFAEMTATDRVGYMRFKFPDTNDARIVFDMENGISDRPINSCVRFVNDTTVVGFRISSGWASKHFVYFAAIFSKPMSQWKVSVNDSIVEGNSVESPHAYGQAFFNTHQGEPVQVKVAISAVSEDNAMLNLRQELPGWDFENKVQKARDRWNESLSCINATFNSKRERTAFYTAMYHLMIAPQLMCDVNGDYRGSDMKIYSNADFKNYTVWSLWDTYRTYHPLATLIFREKQSDWVQTMLHINKEQGFLPIWHLMGSETGCMVGISSVPVLADMCLKGFVSDKDMEDAYNAMKNTMNRPFRDLDKFNKFGYIPYNLAAEDISKSLEYGLNYWSLAQVAKKLGKQDDYQLFKKRSEAYKLLFDKETGFIRPKDDKGVFQTSEGFKPNIQTRSYTEGNPWQYLWLVPHDVSGLCKEMGGKKIFVQQLDSLFATSSDLGESYNPDIAGLIGQYAHGNEPSHHIAYLYNYMGCPWKGAVRLREIMDTFYGDDHMGLPGNEDVGQMSAWYVLSALGLYQVEPCGGHYVIGSPIVNEAQVRMGEGRVLNIKVHNNSPKNIYVQKVMLNGKLNTASYINYSDLVKGGTLEFFMGNKPSKFGTKTKDIPLTY